MEEFDIVVIGSGPGGYVAAIRAAQLGLKAAVIEREHLGGICLNWGCIPTKALLKSSETYHQLHRLGDYGLAADSPRYDLENIIKRSRTVAGKLSTGVSYLLKKNKVTVIEGEAAIGGAGSIIVRKGGENQEVRAQHIIIATGARARTLPGLEPDGSRVWSYKEAMTPTEMPSKLLVVGSGAIGIEFASFYRSLGIDVTVVEALDRILPSEDQEISSLAKKAFEKQGMVLHTGVSIESLQNLGDAVSANMKMSDGELKNETFSHVILAIGVTGNVEELGLDECGVTHRKGQILIDEWCRTNVNGIYAIGDVAGAPWLAHKASHEGIICVEKIAGANDVKPLDKSNIPGCTYCTPQIASLGMTEAGAREQGVNVKVGRFPFMGNGKAIALGEPDGLVKTVFDTDTGKLLGAHMIGAEVTELIQGYAVAKSMGATGPDLMHAIFPHPTLSEMMHESVLGAYNRAIHI